MSTFKLPELGEGLSEGEIVAWRVKEGDTIKADSTLVEVMTDKATVEVPSPRTGVVKKLYYKVGQLAKVGAPLVDLEEGADSGKAAPAPQEQAPAPIHTRAQEGSRPAAAPVQTSASSNRPVAQAQVVESRPATQSPSRVSEGAERVLASPAVRKAARDMGVDLTTLTGSGERGRILRTDLTVSTTTTTVTKTFHSEGSNHLEERIPFVGIRRKISDRLTQSAHTAVHFSHFEEADFTEIIRLREEANVHAAKHYDGLKLSYLPFFIKASVTALKRYPILNSSLDEENGEIVIKHYYNFGISVQTDNGLMVAVVRDCDRKDVFQLAKEIKEVADRARSGKASLQDLTGSTITVTNPGNIGGLYATPIINYPEAVILGMYQIKKRPIVKEVNGEDVIVARPMMYTNITCDHRVVDGAIAAGYLRLFCEYIENPGKMVFF